MLSPFANDCGRAVWLRLLGTILWVSEIRFAVGDPNGRHGLSWRVSNSNNSFYISCRIMKGTHKVSVHPPGENGKDVAFFHGTEEAHRGNMEEPERPRIERYYPRELGPGVRRVATVRVYAASLQVTAPVKKADSVLWFNPPEKYLGVDINILLMERQELARQWCAERQVRPQISIVDRSPMGDLHLHAVYNTSWPQLVIRPDYDSEGGEQESVVGKIGTIAHSIDAIDGSLLIQEVPTFDNWPWKSGSAYGYGLKALDRRRSVERIQVCWPVEPRTRPHHSRSSLTQ
jgi:hypothetical protein